MNIQTKRARWWNDRTLFLYHMGKSNYITATWNWFMILAGKAAEPFLFASVLYSGYELLPGVPQPGAMLDAGVFVAQQATLDIGGMGLMKIAQEEGHGKESFSYRVGVILISLMIANVVLAMMKRLIPNFGGAAAVIEGCLLIARAIMCVVYGYAIHSIRKETRESGSVVKTSDVQDRLEQFSEQIQMVEASTSHQIQSVVESLRQMQSFQQGQIVKVVESLQHVEVGLRYSMDERLQLVESTFQKTMIESLTPVIESLSMLPDLSEQLEQIGDLAQSQLSTVTQEFQQVRVTIEKQVQTLPQYLERLAERRTVPAAQPQATRTPKAPLQLATKRAEVVSAGDFDRRQFVFDCLTEDPDMSISEIQRRATEKGQTISTGSVSMARKAFQESLSIERDNDPSTGEVEKIVVGE